MENKYKDGKIYKLTDNTNDNIYIGSTHLTLEKRLINHKAKFNQFLRSKKNCTWSQSYRILINNDFKIETLENFPCNSRRELENIEDYYIISNECINLNRSFLLKEEVIEKNKKAVEKCRKKNLLEKNQAYFKHRQAGKNWRNNNKLNKTEKYFNELKSNGERGKKIVNCPKCDKSIRYDSLSKHRKSKYCLNYIESSA